MNNKFVMRFRVFGRKTSPDRDELAGHRKDSPVGATPSQSDHENPRSYPP